MYVLGEELHHRSWSPTIVEPTDVFQIANGLGDGGEFHLRWDGL